MRNKKGITLIALVITIIVLLILAGVSLSFIAGENGILGRATHAVKKTQNAIAEEEISLAVSDKIGEYYETDRSKTVLEYFNENLKNYNTPSGAIINCEDGIITYNGIQMATIDEKGKITFDKGTGIEIAYNPTEINENNVLITVTIIAKQDTIKQIEKPDESIENGNGREKIEFTCMLELGKEYKIKVISENGIEKEEILNFRKPQEPVIPEINLAYPVVTLMGLESPSEKIEIQYDESEDFENYYSLDDGKTWSRYVGAITVRTGIKNVRAKSEYKKSAEFYTESVKEVSEGTMADALTEDAYDENLETFGYYEASQSEAFSGGWGSKIKFLVDESTWWNGLKVNYMIIGPGPGYYRSLQCAFFDENGKEIYRDGYRSEEMSLQHEVDELRIPENTRSIVLYSDSSMNLYALSIFEAEETEEFWPVFERNMADGIFLEVSSTWPDRAAYFCCDSNTGSCWMPNSGVVAPHWFKITFKSPRIVKKYYLKGAESTGEKVEFYMQGSHDGVNWINLEGDTVHEGSTYAMEFNIELQNSTAYKYYRFYFPKGNWNYGSSGAGFIHDLKLFGTR